MTASAAYARRSKTVLPDTASLPSLALIAGSGRLPQLLAQAARAQGRRISVFVFDPLLAEAFSGFDTHVLNFAQVGVLMDLMKKLAIGELVMAGKIHRPDFSKLRPDATGMLMLPAILAAAARGDDALISAVVKIFESRGIKIIPPEMIMQELVPVSAQWTVRAPSAVDLIDIEKGFQVARALGALDIGQGVVVADGLVLAAEAAEGTDAMLMRVAQLPDAIRGAQSRRRGVLVKCAKPTQERRVDLPAIGPDTVAHADKAGLSGIAVEAGGSLIIDRDAVIAAADRFGLFVISTGGA